VPEPDEYDALDNELLERVKQIPADVGTEIEKNELTKGLRKTSSSQRSAISTSRKSSHGQT
jgi:hypothetical protein